MAVLNTRTRARCESRASLRSRCSMIEEDVWTMDQMLAWCVWRRTGRGGAHMHMWHLLDVNARWVLTSCIVAEITRPRSPS